MKKIVTFVAVLVLTFGLSAQFKTGMSFRVRAEMYCMNEDYQLWERVTDLRFRPWLSYTQNEYVSAKWVMEIGDVQFGVQETEPGKNDVGGGLGTDGLNVETKNLFLQINPNKYNTVVMGLQSYKDYHSMILDWDIAGISWKSKYDIHGQQLTSFLGWFVSEDAGYEDYWVDSKTYSFGRTQLVADFEFQIDDNMKVGVNNLIQFVREPRTNDGVNVSHHRSTTIWFAPYFEGTFDKFYVEVATAANNVRPENVYIAGDGDTGYTPQHTGGVFSLKTKYDINEDVDARFNFLFRDGDGDILAGYNVFYGIKSYYNTGLDILTEATYGLDEKDTQVYSPFTTFPKNPLCDGNGGIILPAVFVDYNATKHMGALPFINDFKMTLGVGHAMTAIEIPRLGKDMIWRPESWIGTELNFKALIKMYENLNFIPYFAILIPGEWYDHEGGHKPFTKVGLTFNTKLN